MSNNSSHSAMSSANFPTDNEGRVYHLGLRCGDMANRVVTVGDPSRAILAATNLDGGNVINIAEYKKYLNYKDNKISIITSKRMFTTITGRYKGVPVSIIAIGMGTSMMDFFVREARAVVNGEMHILRLGSCGAIGGAKAGSLIIANESMMCMRNPDYFTKRSNLASDCSKDVSLHSLENSPYFLSRSVAADDKLTKAVIEALRPVTSFGAPEVRVGVDVTADSFYSSQGREDQSFFDDNCDLVECIRKVCGNNHVESLQMETFQLLHLARCVSSNAPIRAAACAMVFANRAANSWITPEQLEKLEPACCKAALDAIISVEIPAEMLHPENSLNCVWAKSNSK